MDDFKKYLYSGIFRYIPRYYNGLCILDLWSIKHGIKIYTFRMRRV